MINASVVVPYTSQIDPTTSRSRAGAYQVATAIFWWKNVVFHRFYHELTPVSEKVSKSKWIDLGAERRFWCRVFFGVKFHIHGYRKKIRDDVGTDFSMWFFCRRKFVSDFDRGPIPTYPKLVSYCSACALTAIGPGGYFSSSEAPSEARDHWSDWTGDVWSVFCSFARFSGRA